MSAGAPVFVCHTVYHVLVALIRAMRRRQDDGALCGLVLADTVPGCEDLARRLRQTGPDLWAWVRTVREAEVDAQNNESALYRLRHPGRTPVLALPRGAEVYISNDWSALGRYLQREHIPYTLCEDTVGGTLDPDQHLLTEQRAAPDFAKRRYLYWGDSRWCRAVESEDPGRCALFPPQKLKAFSARGMLAGLTETEKAMARRVFVTKPLPEDPAVYAGATLLLPRSFVQDGLMDQAEQDAIFRAVAGRYTLGTLFIKTHPRDDTDYTALFPEATVLERTMPGEVLNFCLPGRFRRAVTVQSWVLRGFTAAEETVFLSLDEARGLLSQTH